MNIRLAMIGCTYLTACVSPTGTQAPSGHLISSVSYQTEWAEGNQMNPRTFNNDLGYQITLELGYVVHYSVQLVPCANDTGFASSIPFISTAWAGHSGVDDVSITPVPVVDTLHEPVTLELGSIRFTPNRYCQLHYLIGPATDSTENVQKFPLINDKSLYLEGKWTSPSSNESGSFLIESDLANGIIMDLPNQISGEHFNVVLKRPLGSIFAQLDFKNQNAKTQAWQILSNSVDSLELSHSP